MTVCVSCPVTSDSLRPQELYSLPGPSIPRDSPGKNTGVDCHPSSRGSSQPRDHTSVSYVSCIGRQVLYQQQVHESHSIPFWSLNLKMYCFHLSSCTSASVLRGTCLAKWMTQEQRCDK